jgi:hypothetical protein
VDLIKSDTEYVPTRTESPEPAVKMAHGTHFPFDWNGWGIGVDPGESSGAVRTIADSREV